MRSLFLLTFSLLLSISGYGKTFRVGDFEYETDKKSLYANGVKLKKDYSNNQEVTIPATIEYAGIKYSVGSIDDNAFKDNKIISQVTIPGSVYLLDNAAFKGLKSLKKIKVLPVSAELEDLLNDRNNHRSNRKNSTSLLNLSLGDLFTNSESLNTVNSSFVNPNLTIGFSTFANCESLETVDLSNRRTLIAVPKNQYGTKTLGSSYPFENCKSLKILISGDIDFSADNLKVFKGCHILENVIIGSTNPSAYQKLFENDCPFMTEIFPKISDMSNTQYQEYLRKSGLAESIGD